MNDFLTAPRPIRAVLIANRGEIACRIIATCKRLGIRSTAVYSEVDAQARHVRVADAAVPIGGAAPAKSYLNIEAILAAAKAAGVDAIHPGYGFLSENAQFVRAVEEAGLIFVGPTARAVELMGSKVAARQVAQQAGVLVVPGFDSPNASDDEYEDAAERIGYPVIVKASAGGGGRGMRRVMVAADLKPALQSARLEAASAFGDGSVFIEKLITQPRHIEVQVFGDGRGGCLHFHERDCSVQRNHQKVIEEAPAPNLSDNIRKTLFDCATRLAAQIDYAGAGTVEFVMQAGTETPYFLEMNTRLQVEHPVTEAICGVDLVEWQFRQAAGLTLPLTQDQIRPKGHSVEVRLNAERPERNFLPDVGAIRALSAPAGIRFDSGFEAGDSVSSHYDSMLAKAIAYGPSRAAAIAKLVAGIDCMTIAGVGTNLAFLRDCLTAARFSAGEATTDFLSETFPDGWAPRTEALLALRGAAALAAISHDDDPLRRVDGYRVGWTRSPGHVPLSVEDEYGTSEICLVLGREVKSVETDGRSVAFGDSTVWLSRSGGEVLASARGLSLSLSVRALADSRMGGRGRAESDGAVLAPLTGLVTAVPVNLGDEVAMGDTVAVVEAMKLIHTLAAPFDGRVTKIATRVGETVLQKSILLEIEAI